MFRKQMLSQNRYCTQEYMIKKASATKNHHMLRKQIQLPNIWHIQEKSICSESKQLSNSWHTQEKAYTQEISTTAKQMTYSRKGISSKSKHSCQRVGIFKKKHLLRKQVQPAKKINGILKNKHMVRKQMQLPNGSHTQ